MIENVLSVLTYKSIETILDTGGTQSWALDKRRAKACKYVVVCRNAYNNETEGLEAHRSAFLVGQISDVVPSTETDGRWLVLFGKYAEINVGEQWEGRNPIRFYTTDDFPLIDFKTLDWKSMPEPGRGSSKRNMTIAEAKEALSKSLGVPTSAIEITIRA